MFTDANVFNILGMVTHIPIEDAEKPVELLRHEPLGLEEHRFNAVESELVSLPKKSIRNRRCNAEIRIFCMKRPFKCLSTMISD